MLVRTSGKTSSRFLERTPKPPSMATLTHFPPTRVKLSQSVPLLRPNTTRIPVPESIRATRLRPGRQSRTSRLLRTVARTSGKTSSRFPGKTPKLPSMATLTHFPLTRIKLSQSVVLSRPNIMLILVLVSTPSTRLKLGQQSRISRSAKIHARTSGLMKRGARLNYLKQDSMSTKTPLQPTRERLSRLVLLLRPNTMRIPVLVSTPLTKPRPGLRNRISRSVKTPAKTSGLTRRDAQPNSLKLGNTSTGTLLRLTRARRSRLDRLSRPNTTQTPALASTP